MHLIAIYLSPTFLGSRLALQAAHWLAVFLQRMGQLSMSRVTYYWIFPVPVAGPLHDGMSLHLSVNAPCGHLQAFPSTRSLLTFERNEGMFKLERSADLSIHS
jgi:hypothetical protein